MGSLINKYGSSVNNTSVNPSSRLVNKYTSEVSNTNTLPSVLKGNANYQKRLGVSGGSTENESSSNPLMSALKFLSRFTYGANNVVNEFVNQSGGMTPDKFDPIQAYARGWQLKETPLMKENFVRAGMSDKSFYRKQIGPVDFNLNPAGIAGFAAEILNPLDAINWLGGIGLTKGVAKGATGIEALTKSFGETAARDIADKLGVETTAKIGARTVGDLTGQVSDLVKQYAPDNFDDIVNTMKQGVIDTGNQATTKLPYNVSKQLTQKIAPPFGKTIKEFAIPGTEPIVAAASKLGNKIKSTKLGDWFGKNFSTKYVPNSVPNRVQIKNLNAINTLEQLMNDLRANPGPETNMTLDALQGLKTELENYKINTKIDVPSWLHNTSEWVDGSTDNPIYNVLKPYIEGKGIQTDLGEAAQTTLDPKKGYHAGDMGKAEYLESMNGRGTGHYGTGTYFVGSKEAAGFKNYMAERPVVEHEMDGYNLYKPKTEQDGLLLHDFLKQVNKFSYGDARYRDSLKELLPKAQQLFPDISKEQLVAEIRNLRKYTRENYNFYQMPTKQLDSPSTVFMKGLGYEGVDVRGYNMLDNTDYGSVVYNVRGNADYKQFAPTFFSKLAKVIETKMSNNMPVDQFTNFISKQGITQEELKWMDLQGLVEGKTHVTKQEAQDWMTEHAINIEEVTKSGDIMPEKIAKQLAEYHNVKDSDIKDWARDLANDYDEEIVWESMIHKGISEGEADDLVKKLVHTINSDIDYPKYESYKVPGGKNYQEMLFTLPAKSTKADEELAVQLNRAHMEAQHIRDKLAVQYHSNPTEELKQQLNTATINTQKAREALDNHMNKPKANYQSGHWDEKNVLAHVRFDTREVNGKKVLFIQEVQSDWHQTGRKQGYLNIKQQETDKVRLNELTPELNQMIRNNDYLGFDNLSQARAALIREPDAFDLGGKDLELATEWSSLMQRGMDIAKGVPDAPMQKTWPEFVMKRMLRYAAEHDYDGIAWATGKQNADHYGLSQVVDKLEYDTRNQVLMGYKNNQLVVNKFVNPEDLGDHVGQEYATKLMDTTPKELKVVSVEQPYESGFLEDLKSMGFDTNEIALTKNTVYQVQDQFGNVYYQTEKELTANKALESLIREGNDKINIVKVDDEVGGQGMKKFYDQMLPNTMNKYVKKWGAKTEQMEIPVADKTEMITNLSDYDFYDNLSTRLENEGELTTKNLVEEVDDSIGSMEDNLREEGDYTKVAFTPDEAKTFAQRFVDTAKRVGEDESDVLHFTDDEAVNKIAEYLNTNYAREANNSMSMQNHIPITEEMKNEVLYNGQPLFKKGGNPAGPFQEALTSPDRIDQLIKTVQKMFKLDRFEAIKVANSIEDTLYNANREMGKQTKGFDLYEELSKITPDKSTELYSEIMSDSRQWFQGDWKTIVQKVHDITGADAENSFKIGMQVRTMMDRLYDQVPDEMKPYFTGILDDNTVIGIETGIDLHSAKNYGFVYNYKGAPIFHPINTSESGFNKVANSTEGLRAIMDAIDGMKEGKLLPQNLEKFIISPSENELGVMGTSMKQSGLIFIDPATIPNTYAMDDTLYHEIAHQAQRKVAGGNSSNYASEANVENYIDNVLVKDDEHIANLLNKNSPDEIKAIMDKYDVSEVDKVKFAQMMKNIDKQSMSTNYGYNTIIDDAEKGFLEGVAEDAMLYTKHPELYRELFPARAEMLEGLYQKASENLIPVEDIMKATKEGSDAVISQYQKGIQYVDEQINKILGQLDQAKLDLENASLSTKGGARAYKEIKKGLIDVFERSSAKETDFLQEIEVLFKGTSEADRKAIMNSLALGEDVAEHLKPQAEAFKKWREAVIKEYNDLGIPVKALENYVPFIPMRTLSVPESKMLNTLFNTGDKHMTGDLSDWLFDIDPNLQQRTTKAITPAEVNRVLGKEWLTEDAALAMAIRGTRAIKAQESITLMKGVLDKYGLSLEDIAANQHNVPRGYKFYSPVIEGTGKPILKEMEKIDANSNVFALPEDFAKTFNEYTSLLHDPQASNAFLKFYDSATNWYKKFAYLWNPGHIPRDTVSNIFNGWLMGNNSIKSYSKAAEVLFDHLSKKTDKMVEFGGKQITNKELWDLANKYGMIDVGASLAETPMEVMKKLGGKGKTYSDVMRNASRANDAWTRLANFMFLVNEKGMKPEQAAVQVKKFLFDYFDLTSFERKVMRRIVPFYSWMRKNMPLQVEQLIQNPKKYGYVDKTLRNIQGENYDAENNPDFINESGAIKLPGKDGQRVYAAPNLPYTDLARIPTNMNSMGNLLASISPLIRAPFIEMPTNTQLFSGRQIAKYPGEEQDLPFASIIKRLTGADVPQVDKRGLGYLINQLPLLRNLDAISNPDNPRQMPKISSFIGGPNYYTEDQVKKSSAYQERDALRNAIKMLTDQGIDVPTINELKQETKSSGHKSLADKYR